MHDLGAVKAEIKLASSDLQTDELLRFVEAANKGGTVFQLFDHGSVINESHLYAAYLNTILSFEDKTNIASKPYIEMLLFTAMTKQINEAIKIAGIKSPRSFVVFSTDRATMQEFGRLARLGTFVPKESHVRKIAGRFRIKVRKSINQDIFMSMAVSRLTV
jgi:tRNA threonylcarbamoyladenosine modification (KEOPS) complex Cgi121 subunit